MLTGARLKDKIKPFAKRLRGIAHENRLAILYLLAYYPLQMHEIAENLNLPENLAAHHLKQMHVSGWLLKTKLGRTVTYRLNDKAFFEFNRLFADTPFERQVLSKYYK
mgnify:FL=1